jgi:hypothetical protein
VGLTIGERPHLTFGNNEPLKEMNVVTVEPGVYIPTYGGARIEDTVAITSRGVENLTRVQKSVELTWQMPLLIAPYHKGGSETPQLASIIAGYC